MAMYDEDQETLAAEYVLGTLSSEEREHAEALRSFDPKFESSVQQWERRLGELNVMVEAVEPSPAVWDKVKGQIEPAESTKSRAGPAAAVIDGGRARLRSARGNRRREINDRCGRLPPPRRRWSRPPRRERSNRMRTSWSWPTGEAMAPHQSGGWRIGCGIGALYCGVAGGS